MKFLIDAFQDATRSKYGYLLLDFHPHMPSELRVRGNIFQNDEIDICLQGEAEIPHVEKGFQFSAEGYLNPAETKRKDANFVGYIFNMKKAGARLSAKRSSVRRALKFFSTCKDPFVQATVIKRTPDPVLKQICNSALNAERGG